MQLQLLQVFPRDFLGALYVSCLSTLCLQAGTSHNLGSNFAVAFGTQFVDEQQQLRHVHQTSWGMSTRMVGGIIMAHGDDKGLRLPPNVAPYQVWWFTAQGSGSYSNIARLFGVSRLWVSGVCADSGGVAFFWAAQVCTHCNSHPPAPPYTHTTWVGCRPAGQRAFYPSGVGVGRGVGRELKGVTVDAYSCTVSTP